MAIQENNKLPGEFFSKMKRDVDARGISINKVHKESEYEQPTQAQKPQDPHPELKATDDDQQGGLVNFDGLNTPDTSTFE